MTSNISLTRNSVGGVGGGGGGGGGRALFIILAYVIVPVTIIVHDSLVSVAKRHLHSCEWITYIKMAIVTYFSLRLLFCMEYMRYRLYAAHFLFKIRC